MGVTRVERRGEAVVLACTDSDAAIRALLATFPDARDIEISGAGLEEAFLTLTQGLNRAYLRFELLGHCVTAGSSSCRSASRSSSTT